MISRWVRTWYAAALNPFLIALARLGISANALTIASLVVVIVAGVLLAFGNMIAAAWVLMLGGLLDGLDGPLARVSGDRSPLGGFLDSVCDHCGDFAIYLGMLFLSIRAGSPAYILLIFIAMFASVFGSHVRSRAGTVNIDTKTIGLFTRFERIFLLFLCLLIGRIGIALWGLAVFNSFSALQRVLYVLQAYRSGQAGSRIRKTL